MPILSQDFYLQTDVVDLAQRLLGTYLITEIQAGQKTVGRIVETEAYRGPEDKASHAYNLRRTARTETMFLPGGVAYVYLCYGIHHLFNVVTGPKEMPHAILIRAIEPIEGMEWMLARRKFKAVKPTLTAGPGAMSKAMGITTALDKTSLTSETIWIEERDPPLAKENILSSPRVGIAYAEEDALKPWRFRIKDNVWASRAK